MSFRYLMREQEGETAILTLNRPERRNALSLALMEELIAALDRIAADGSVRAVILAASGEVYCSGHDLRELRGGTVAGYRRLFDTSTRLMSMIQAIPQPVIGEVQGLATAAGCQLVATCDLVVAGERAAFATPGVRIGLFCTTPMVALTRVIGRKRAMEMLLTGRLIDAQTAADWGLVNRVVPQERLREESLNLAAQIAQASGLVTSLGKQAFYAQIELDQARAYAYAKEVMTMNALAADAQEGIAAFLEKRAPCWKST